MKTNLARAASLAAAIAVSSFAQTAAFAQQAPSTPGASAPAQSDCLAPSVAAYGRLNWFLGLNPTDDLLTAWCRLQALPGDANGNVRFNMLWPLTNASKSWDTTFRGHYPASKVVDLIRTVLPTDKTSVKSDSGVAFSDVLANVVQLEAASAPDGTKLGFAPKHPAAKQLALWEPLALRVKPVVLAGQNFTLSVYLRPNLGMLALSLGKQATDVQINGWSGRFQLGNYFRTSCSAFFPDCKTVPDVATFHMPLIVDTVKLEATGENMTAAAIAIGQQLYLSNPGLTPTDPMKAFNSTSGTLTFYLADADGQMSYEAKGTGGTKSIVITYKVKEGPGTVRSRLAKIGEDYRAGTGEKKEEPKGADTLGNL